MRLKTLVKKLSTNDDKISSLTNHNNTYLERLKKMKKEKNT